MFALSVSASALPPLRVAALSHHNGAPSTWNASCAGADVWRCNLQLYESAAAQTVAAGADLLLYPEAYGLDPDKILAADAFEPWVTTHGAAVNCSAPSNAAPRQTAVGCAAARHAVAIAANFFVTLPSNGSKRIVQVVYGPTGTVAAAYFKHHLFPTEALAGVEPGPFAPTTVRIGGRTLGLLICYEGVVAAVSPAQLEALRDQGMDTLLWSVGGEVPIETLSKSFSKKYNVSVAASMDRAAAVMFSADAQPAANTTELTVSAPGNTGDEVVLVGTV